MRPTARSGSALGRYICPSCRRGGLAFSSASPARRFATSSSTSEQALPPDVYDVVCVGGGPAGLGLLAALRSSPITSKLKIALIEAQDLNAARSWNTSSTPQSPSASEQQSAPHFSNRVSSLTPTSVSFLQRIGAWHHLDTSRVQEYHEMQVWDGETGSRISFDWSMETGAFEDLRTVATMTENANLVRALLARIDAADNTAGEGNVSIFSNARVSKIENGTDLLEDGPDFSAWPVVSISSPTATATATAGSGSESTTAPPSRIAARLLIGADGINSPVRSFANITTDGWDYDRHGVVATLALAEPDTPPFPLGMRTAYQRFLPSLGGPIALLPLPDNHATLVWSTTVAHASYLKSLSPKAFIAMVNAAFRLSMTDLKYMINMQRPSTATTIDEDPHDAELAWRLQHTPQPTDTQILPPMVTAVQENSIASFPLRFRHASSYISPRVALVGDAAHVIHPLAGQGLNLGLGDIASLSQAIEYAVQHGMDIGDLLSLERYAAERYAVNAKVGAVCDVLHKLYNVEGQGPVAWARGVGLEIVDKVPFLKGFLMKQAQG